MSRTAILICLVALFAVAFAAEGENAPKAPASSAPPIPDAGVGFIIVAASAAGLAFAVYWYKETGKIEIDPAKAVNRNEFLTDEIMGKIHVIAVRVSDGATTFLMAEYKYLAIFMAVFGHYRLACRQ